MVWNGSIMFSFSSSGACAMDWLGAFLLSFSVHPLDILDQSSAPLEPIGHSEQFPRGYQVEWSMTSSSACSCFSRWLPNSSLQLGRYISVILMFKVKCSGSGSLFDHAHMAVSRSSLSLHPSDEECDLAGMDMVHHSHGNLFVMSAVAQDFSGGIITYQHRQSIENVKESLVR